MLRPIPSAVSAGAASGAAVLGLLARSGRVPPRLRWCHHALYLISVAAAMAGAPATWRGGRRRTAVVPVAVLALMPATHPGSRRHALVGVAVVATLVSNVVAVVAAVVEEG